MGNLRALENESGNEIFFWRRSWFDWERDMVVEFERLLEGVAIRRQVEDCWCWVEDSSSMYMVRSTYTVLYNLRFDTIEVDIFKSLWQIKIPQQVTLFL